MRIAHSNPTTDSIGHEGQAYERDEHGGFEVPQHVAEWFMTKFPRFWREADPIPLAALVAEPEAEGVPGPVPETDPEQVAGTVEQVPEVVPEPVAKVKSARGKQTPATEDPAAVTEVPPTP